MKLNEYIPGLPEWPRIDENALNEYSVEAKHARYRGFFRTITRVRFTGSQISIDGKRFSTDVPFFIQFRSEVPAMSEESIAKMQQYLQRKRMTNADSPAMKFRKIEMVYGARIIFITTMADHTVAEKFGVLPRLDDMKSYKILGINEQPIYFQCPDFRA